MPHVLYIQYCSFYITYRTAVSTLLYIQYCSFYITLHTTALSTLHTILQFLHYFTYSTAVSVLRYFLFSNAVCVSPFLLSSNFQAGIVPPLKGKETNIFRSLYYAVCVCVCMYTGVLLKVCQTAGCFMTRNCRQGKKFCSIRGGEKTVRKATDSL